MQKSVYKERFQQTKEFSRRITRGLVGKRGGGGERIGEGQGISNSIFAAIQDRLEWSLPDSREASDVEARPKARQERVSHPRLGNGWDYVKKGGKKEKKGRKREKKREKGVSQIAHRPDGRRSPS